MKPPRVLLSYSHDSPEHADRVRRLADALRADGVDAWIDQYEPHPAEGWPRWMHRQLDEADFVLLVCTARYRDRFDGRAPANEGAGVNWEGLLTANELYASHGRTERFIPVLFEPTPELVPAPLRGHTRYQLPEQYTDLLRRLTGQPKTKPPPLGAPVHLPALPAAAGAPTRHPAAASAADQALPALARFLLAAFSVDELRRLVRYDPSLAVVSDELPGSLASAVVLVDALVDALNRHGLLGEALFDRLRAERPRRAAEIERLAAMWNGGAAEGTAERPPAPPAAAPAGGRARSSTGPASVGELEHAEELADLVHALQVSLGFELLPVQVAGEATVEALERALGRAGWAVIRLPPLAGAGWAQLDTRLLTLRPPQRGIVIAWVVETESQEARQALAAVNIARDQLARALPCPLLWVGRTDALVESARRMPDLWSIRAPTRVIEAADDEDPPVLPIRLPRAQRADPIPLRRAYEAATGAAKTELGEALAEALLSAGELPEARRLAAELPTGAGAARVRRAILRARVAWTQPGAAAEARRHLDDGRQLGWTIGPNVHLNGWYALLDVMLDAGRDPSSDQAHVVIERIGKEILPAFASGAPAELAGTFLLRAAMRERTGDLPGAEIDVRHALQVATAAWRPDLEGDANLALAALLRRAGRLVESKAAALAAAEAYWSAGLPSEEFLARREATRRDSPAN